MKEEHNVWILFSHWASALINNDYSGLEPEDEADLRQFLQECDPGSCVGCSEEAYFSWGNDWVGSNERKGGMVLEYTFIKTL